jgi:hypothetical protein
MRPTVDDLLLEELERARDARMRDIVATIQGDQYRLIAREPEPPLVVRGGPGTGEAGGGPRQRVLRPLQKLGGTSPGARRRPEPDLHGLRGDGGSRASKKSCGACELGTSD